MKRFSLNRIGMFVLLLLVATQLCYARKKQKTPQPKPSEETAVRASRLSEAERRRFTYFFLEAKKQQILGNTTAAFDLYQHCLAIDPDAPEALHEMGLFQYVLGQDSVGLRMIERAATLESNNTRYQEMLASAYLRNGNVEGTIRVCEHLASLQPTRTDVLGRLCELYKYNDQPDKAIEVLNKLELIDGKSSQYSLAKYNLYLEMGDESKAFDEMIALCEENPHDMACRLTLADLYVDKDQLEKAYALYQEVEHADPSNPNLLNSMLTYYEKSGQTAAYNHLRDSLLYTPTVPSEMRMRVISDFIDGAKDSTGVAAADSIFQRILTKEPDDVYMLRAYMVYQMYIKHSPEEDVVATMHRMLKAAPDNLDCTKLLLQYYLQQENDAEAEKICRQGIVYHADELSFHYFLGAIIYKQDREKEAALALETGIRHINEESDAGMASDIYAMLGDIYHGLGREQEAFEAYDSCLVYNEDNVSCLNNYAYYLSLKGDQLDRAEKMSYRTVRIEPNNKTYLDTYAWILFVEGDYEMARSYIDRVVDPAASDSALLTADDITPVLLEHAGDIYWLCNRTNEALRYWKLALEGDGNNALLAKKVKLKKYIK